MTHAVNRTVLTWPWPFDKRVFLIFKVCWTFDFMPRDVAVFGLTLINAPDWWMLRKEPRVLSDYSVSIVKNKLTFSLAFFSLLSYILLSNAKAFKESLVCSQRTLAPALLLILPLCSALQSFQLPPPSVCLSFLFSPLLDLYPVFFSILVRQDEQTKWRQSANEFKKMQKNLFYVHPQRAEVALALLQTLRYHWIDQIQKIYMRDLTMGCLRLQCWAVQSNSMQIGPSIVPADVFHWFPLWEVIWGKHTNRESWKTGFVCLLCAWGKNGCSGPV